MSLQDGPPESDAPLSSASETARSSTAAIVSRTLEQLPLPAYICDDAHRLVYFNPLARRLWDYQPDHNVDLDVAWKLCRLSTPQTGRPLAPQETWTARALRTNESPIEMPVLIERADGLQMHALAHAQALVDTDGTRLGVLSVIVDSTGQSKAFELQTRLAAIIESSEDAIVSKSLDGRILSWNRGAERLFGYSAAEAIGHHITLIIPPERIEEEHTILERLGRGERIDHFETIRIDKAGRRLEISLAVSPIRDGSGRVVGASKVARDITASKRASASIVSLTKELAMQLHDLRRLNDMSSRLSSTLELQPTLDEIVRTAVALEGADMGMLSLWDSQSQCLRVGASVGLPGDFLAQVTEIPPGTGACGLCFLDQASLVIQNATEDPRFAAYRDLARLAGFRSIHSLPLMTRTGEVIGVLSLQFREEFVPDDRKQHVMELCVRQAVDFIENARLYAELREADRRKDEFIATLAHELRNPLAPISNALQILSMTEKPGSAVDSVRAIMERQVNHLVRLVDDLLEVARITRGKIELRREVVPLGTIIESAVETSRPLIQEAAHQLTVEIPTEPLMVDVDPIRISQVLANLLNNAAKYTDEGGRISITAQCEKSTAVIRVRDNGHGISPETLPRVFDMFLQSDRTRARERGGLGIGLTLARRLIQMHGATIEAHSKGIGHGSEFVIRLPVVETPVPIAPQTEAAGPQTLPEHRILVVDDTRAAAHVLTRLLQTMGQSVTSVNSALAALEVLAHDPPEILISDISMPEIDGFELARRVRAQPEYQDIVLVALTGYGQESDRQQTRAAGFDHHLVKPVGVDELRKLLEEVRPQRSEAT